MKHLIAGAVLCTFVLGCNQSQEKMDEAAVRDFAISHIENQIGYDAALEGTLAGLSSNLVTWVNPLWRNSPKPFEFDKLSGEDFYEDSIRVNITDILMMGDHANVMGTIQWYIAGVETGYRNFSGIVTQENDDLKWLRFVGVDDNTFSRGFMFASSQLEGVRTPYMSMRRAMLNIDNPRAKEISDSLVGADPTWAAAHLGQLQYYFMRQDAENFKMTYDAAVSKLDGATQAERHAILGFDLDPEVAKHHLEQALIFAPIDPMIRIWYAYREADAQRAIEILDLAWERLPGLGAINNMMGYKYMDLGDYERAKQHFEIYLRVNPDVPNAYDSYGDYYAEVGDSEKAKEMYMKAYELNNGWTASKAKADAL